MWLTLLCYAAYSTRATFGHTNFKLSLIWYRFYFYIMVLWDLQTWFSWQSSWQSYFHVHHPFLWNSILTSELSKWMIDLPRTVTTKSHAATFPAESEALQVTMVSPNSKVSNEWEQTRSGELSTLSCTLGWIEWFDAVLTPSSVSNSRLGQ